MKSIRTYLNILFLLAVSFLVSGKVMAATYDVNITPVDVTSSCDLSDETGMENCYFDYLDGALDDKIITSGETEPGMKIMNIVSLVPGSGSVLTGVKVTLENDASMSSALGVYGVAGPDGASYGFFPKKGRNTTWTTSVSHPSATSFIMIADKGDNVDYPLVAEAPMWAAFYEVNSSPATNKDVVFSFGKSLSASNASDSATPANNLPLTLHDLSLSIASSASDDGSFSSLTATGKSSTNSSISRVYPFGFVANDDSVTTYSFTVPNDVDQIVFSGTANDVNAKVVTGLNSPISLNVGDNTITNVTVVPESGSKTVIYQFNIKRLSNDTTLKTVSATNSVNYGNVSTINSNSGASITIPYKTTSTTPTITANNDQAVVTYDPTWTFNTDDLTNVKTTKTVHVKAEDCKYTASAVPGNVCTEKDYTFETTRTAPSKNVNLSGITVDGTAVTPFDSTGATTTYNLPDVLYTTTSINLQATLADSKSKIDSGTGVKTVSVGDNTYKIIVKSEDCESGPTNICTTKEYTVKLHQKSHESQLNALNVTSTPAKSLSPAFSPSYDATAGEYTYSYDPSSSQVTVSATAKDTTYAYVTIIDMSTSEAIDTTTKTLGSASKTFPITTSKVGVIVTAEDGDNRVYKINIEKEKSIDATLSALSIAPGTINETFNPATKTYTATVGPEVENVTVSATPNHSEAQVTSITGDTNFNFGAGNIITVTVKAEAGNTENYTINVTRELYKIATLDDLRVGIGSATPTTVTGFSSNVEEYTISTESSPIPYSTNSITIQADKTNSYATITGDTGAQTLATGDNTFTITVTAHDTSVTKTYKIHAYRAKNTDNSTVGVTVAGIAASATSDPQVYEVSVPNSVASIAKSDVVISIPDGATLSQPNASMNLVTTSVNTYNYTITSEAGVSQVYTINITREKSNNANVLRVNAYVDGEATSSRYCLMSASDDSCRIEVPVGTSSYKLEAILPDGATITPDNSTEYTMSASASDSIQTRNLTVTAEDNTTTKAYTITVERTKSSNANLSDITITDVTNTASPSVIPLPSACYDAASELTQVCNITVNANVNDITITANTADTKATILTTLPIEVSSLPFGLTTKTIQVQAENTTVSKTYTINITKANSTDVTLEDLQVNSIQITSFAPATTTYTYPNQVYATTSLNIYAKANDENSTITSLEVIDKDNNNHPVTITSGREINANVTLLTGLNKIKFTVTAQDTSITQDYEIDVERAQNNSTAITAISVAGQNATVDSSDSHKYYVTVPNNVDEANATNVVVSPEAGALPTDALATYTVPTLALQTLDSSSTAVENELTIPVVAEDGTLQNYTVIITRTPSDVVTMNRVNLYEGTDTTITNYCVFAGTDTTCTISLGESATAFTLEGVLDEANAKVTFVSGAESNPFTLAAGETSKVITATVTAENNTTTKEYTINISREKSSVSDLSNISIQDVDGNEIGTWNTPFTTPGEYTITLPYDTEEFYVYPIKGEANQKIVGIPTDNRFPFNAYSVIVNVSSTSDDDSNTSNYKLTFVRYVNSNANLEKLVPSDGTLTPTFAKETTSYQLSISNETTSVSLRVKAEDNDAKVSTNGVDYYSTKDADHEFEYTGLVVGNNDVAIYVKSSDGTINEYDVTINRQAPAASNENHLSGLTVSDATNTYAYTPTFSSEEANYTLVDNLDFDIESLTINATKVDENATIKYYVDNVEQSSNVVNIPKVNGTKQIKVEVTAENNDVRNYFISYTKLQSSNANLSNIIDSLGLITDFDKDTLEYEITVDKDTSSISFDITTEDPKATITIDSSNNKGSLTYEKTLVDGRNEVNIVVNAEDGTAKNYTIIINKETESEIITSIVYGHTIANGMIKTARLNDTVLDLKNQLDNDNSKLVVYASDNTTVLGDSTKLATGQIVKLVINGEVVDSDIVVVKGDTDGNGKITLLDAVKTINHYLKSTSLTGEYLEAADTDNNNKITLLDAVKIINHYLGSSSLF